MRPAVRPATQKALKSLAVERPDKRRRVALDALRQTKRKVVLLFTRAQKERPRRILKYAQLDPAALRKGQLVAKLAPKLRRVVRRRVRGRLTAFAAPLGQRLEYPEFVLLPHKQDDRPPQRLAVGETRQTGPAPRLGRRSHQSDM